MKLNLEEAMFWMAVIIPKRAKLKIK